MFRINDKRGFPTECLARPGIERKRDGVELLLGIDRQVAALGHVLAQQAIGIFVRSPLPRAVRIGKIDLNAGALGEDFVAMHFAPLIVGHGLAKLGRLTIEHGRETVDDGSGTGIVHLGQHHEAGRTLDQGAHRGAIAFALDQVTFQVPGDQTVFNLWRAYVNALHVLDLTAPVYTPATWFAYLVVMTQASDQLALEFAARMQIDRVVDRLVRDRFVGVVGPHDAQYVRNLLRRPELLQKMPDHHEEHTVAM